jgi:hypothetical protein
MNSPIEAPPPVDLKEVPPAATTEAAKTIRSELCAVLEKKPFGIAELQRIVAIAKAGRALLQATSNIDPALLSRRGAGGISLGGATYMPSLGEADIDFPQAVSPMATSETFGATALREIKAFVPKLLEAKRSPAQLVQAMAVARREGLSDVEADIRAELDEAIGSRAKQAVAEPDIKTEETS